MPLQDLSPKQREAVNTIDEDIEIIACAGAGKTGVVTHRIVNILKNKPDISPENIAAFTFTKKAAEELKNRIYAIGKTVLGNTHGFANMYIGTIHGFCLKMLQEFLPEFQAFSVLDEVHTKLFVERYYEEIGMSELGLIKYVETDLFIRIMSLLNENWYDCGKWSAEVQSAFENYQKKLYAEKRFDYSLILREMVHQLESNLIFRSIIAERVKYLTVDEYQDTNPVQERLVSILRELGANLCVVGDDDQTIYQFRGSDSSNILTFMQRYNIKKYIVLDTDYRSTEGIVNVARNVIVHNSKRLPKEMKSGCPTLYDNGDKNLVQVPNHSEHQTGLAFDISNSYKPNTGFTETYQGMWFKQHANEYGFILRYPIDKVSITGISNEQWHFRYVGELNATIIKENNLTLEEYIDYFDKDTIYEVSYNNKKYLFYKSSLTTNKIKTIKNNKNIYYLTSDTYLTIVEK